jgi:transcriptional regulator with XRE-family HTH domain
MAIGDHIRDLRWGARLKQVELARRAGIAQNTLSQIELGNTVPSVPTLEKIARGLGVSADELLREPALPLGRAPSPGPPQVVRERLQEHFENVRQDEVDYLNHKVIADLWRWALPGEKPEKLEAHFVPQDIDTDRIWQFLEHALGARNVFGPEEAERIRRGAVRKAALAR